ncbi:MAG: hypothetical protein M1829_003026 [Trizodia sp. TS-e1964]|nr:MAG: hypothetical protein M1829_003026 [Trizodia sp. TS-e1964]
MLLKTTLLAALVLPLLALAALTVTPRATKSNTQIFLEAARKVQGSLNLADVTKQRNQAASSGERWRDAPVEVLFSSGRDADRVMFFLAQVILEKGVTKDESLRMIVNPFSQAGSEEASLREGKPFMAAHFDNYNLSDLKVEGWILSTNVFTKIVRTFKLDVSENPEMPAGKQVYNKVMSQLEEVTNQKWFPL